MPAPAAGGLRPKGLTETSPMCGCGATSIGLLLLKVSGPKRSRKHHGPTRRLCLTGSAREYRHIFEAEFAVRIGLARAESAPGATHVSAATGLDRRDTGRA